MTDNTDVLVTVYLGLIESEDDAQLGHWDDVHHVRAMRLLAAEVRALRESEKALELQVWDSEMARLESAKEIAELRKKLGLQEPDATLGRVVREGRELLK